MTTRTFNDAPAIREKTPILVGLVGPSGTGKTFSALRLAAGFQRITGGETFVIDTEARRSLHYAEKFKFRHVPFGQPFSPLDYLAAIEHCLKKGATTIVVDSMSHEHEGPGGVLEMHESELDRMAGQDWGKREKLNMLAWAKPKQQRRRLINAILQMSCNFVFCFRAKEKIKLRPGQAPEPLGYMPIAGEEFIFEMTLKCLLLPGANGVPTWQPQMIGEKAMTKLPEQFRALFSTSPPPQLTEDVGEQLARWGAGTSAPPKLTADQLVEAYKTCSDAATWRALEESRRVAWSEISKADKPRVKAASDETAKRLEDSKPAPAAGADGELSEADKKAIEMAEAAGA